MNEETKNYISVKRASELCGLSPQTLRKLADENKIEYYKTLSGQRRFNQSYIQKMCHNELVNKEIPKIERINYLYSRVSSKKQQDDLYRQFEYIRSKNPKYSTYTSLQDIGSGINFKRKGLNTILESCLQGAIGEIVIAHKDRLCRFGFELIKTLVEKSGGTITIIDDEEDRHKSSEQELSEDLLSIVQIYCCKSMGSRRYKNKNTQDSNKSIQIST